MKRISKPAALKLVAGYGNYTGGKWTIRTVIVHPPDGSVSGAKEQHQIISYSGKRVLLLAMECGSGKVRCYAL